MIYSKAFSKVMDGMSKLTNVVDKTLGPFGKNVLIYDYDILISSDGLKIAKDILKASELEVKTEKSDLEYIGMNYLINAAELTKASVGDGTTSTIVFCNELINNIEKYDNLLGIDQAMNDIFFELNKIAFEVRDYESLKNVAYTASNSKKISEIVAKAVMEIGEYGLITIEPTYQENIDFVLEKGFILDRGYASSYFANNGQIILKDAYAILVDDNITKIEELERIICDIKDINKDLLIIANNYSKEVIDYIIFLRKSNNYNICAISTPEYGNNAKDVLEDIGIYLNSVIITTKTVFHTKDTIGKASYIEVRKDNTIIKRIDDQVNQLRINKRIEYLTELAKENSNEFLKKRIARLSNGIGCIKIPASKDYEYEVNKEKTFNAINSTMNAYKYKGVLGGGEALNQIYNVLIEKIDDIVLYPGYLRMINTLPIISRRIGKTVDAKIEKMNNIIDPVNNIKAIISNSVYITKLFFSIDDIIIVNRNNREKKDDFLNLI